MESPNREAFKNNSPVVKHTDFSIDTLLKATKPVISASKEQHVFSYEDNVEDFDEDYGDADDEESLRKTPTSDNLCHNSEPRNESPDYYNSKETSSYHWLSCTRFKPPKLPRSKKRIGCKRYGRGPRIPFAPHQIAVLESTFVKSQYLSSECIHRLADTLHLSETRVKIWFQNRRARFRREKEASIPGHAEKNILIPSAPEFHYPNLAGDSRRSMFPDNQILETKLEKYCEFNELDKMNSEKPIDEVLRSVGGAFSSKRNDWVPESIMTQLHTYRQVQQQLQNYIFQNQTMQNKSDHPSTATILQSVLQYAHAAAAAQQNQNSSLFESSEPKVDASNQELSPSRLEDRERKSLSPQQLSPSPCTNVFYNNPSSSSIPFQLPFH